MQRADDPWLMWLWEGFASVMALHRFSRPDFHIAVYDANDIHLSEQEGMNIMKAKAGICEPHE